MSDFAVYLPISKIDEEKRMVWGYASTPTKDLQGEIVKVSAIKAALPDYMAWGNIREMHQPSAVGITTEHNVTEKGLYIGAKIVDEPAWQKCKERVYKGFSIGGNTIEKVGDTITAIQLIEISLVDRPANPDCKIDAVKGVMEVTVAGVDAEPVAEPSRASLISKFLDMGAKLLGVEKVAPVVADPPPPVPQPVPVVVPTSLDFELEENTMKLADAQALAKKYNITVEEVAKRLSKSRHEHMEKAAFHLKKAQALHAKCMKCVGKSLTDGSLVKALIASGIEKGEAENLTSHLHKMSDEHDMVEHHMGKAAGGHVSQGGMAPIDSSFDDSGDVKTRTQGELTEGEVDELSMFAVDSPYSEAERHKGAQVNQQQMTELVTKAITEALKPMEKQVQDLRVENAELKGRASAMAMMPGQGRRAQLFAQQPKGAGAFLLGDGSDDVNAEISKAWDTIDPNDPDSATRAAAHIIGVRTLANNGRTFGKSLFDPEFKGAAGNRRH